MQPAFNRVFDELYPLLRELGNEGQETAEAAKRRLTKLKAQYDHLGKPREARDPATREYLAKVQALGKELQDRVLALCPLKIDLSYSRRAGLR